MVNSTRLVTHSTIRAVRLLAALDFLLLPKTSLGSRESAAVELDLFEAATAADGDAHQGLFGHVHRDLGLPSQALVHEPQKGAASGQDHPPVHDVRGELRRGAVQGIAHRRDDRIHRDAYRLPDLVARNHDRLGQARYEVPPPYLRRLLALQEEGAAELYL